MGDAEYLAAFRSIVMPIARYIATWLSSQSIIWSGGLDPPMGDAEYLAAFRSIVMPIARYSVTWPSS
jgi:acetoin utilization deacetylase AcuC-like enzyme